MAKLRPVDEWTREQKAAARAVLLEPSPYEIDGGELIGRDPRSISVEEFAKVGIEANPLLKVLRAKCLDCCGEQESESGHEQEILCEQHGIVSFPK